MRCPWSWGHLTHSNDGVVRHCRGPALPMSSHSLGAGLGSCPPSSATGDRPLLRERATHQSALCSTQHCPPTSAPCGPTSSPGLGLSPELTSRTVVPPSLPSWARRAVGVPSIQVCSRVLGPEGTERRPSPPALFCRVSTYSGMNLETREALPHESWPTQHTPGWWALGASGRPRGAHMLPSLSPACCLAEWACCSFGGQ